MPGQENAIRSEGNVSKAFVSPKLGYEGGQVVPQQRLTARESHFVDTEVNEDAHQAVELFKRQNRLSRQPNVFLARHAVPAAHVAAVGHRDAQ
jgi:hypothetical protein